MKYLLLTAVVGPIAPMGSLPAGVLSASWQGGKVVVASFQLTPEAAKPISALLTHCSSHEVRFELELLQNRRYWPDSVVARTLVKNRVKCDENSARTLTRLVDGVVVDTRTTPNFEEALRFVSSTGHLSAFPGLTESASRLSFSVRLNSTVLSNDREVLAAPHLAHTMLLRGEMSK